MHQRNLGLTYGICMDRQHTLCDRFLLSSRQSVNQSNFYSIRYDTIAEFNVDSNAEYSA